MLFWRSAEIQRNQAFLMASNESEKKVKSIMETATSVKLAIAGSCIPCRGILPKALLVIIFKNELHI